MNPDNLVNRIASDLYRVPGLKAQFQNDPARVLSGYPLSETQRAGLMEGSFPSLAEAGMHPLVQMIYSVARHPAINAQISAKAYIDDVMAEER